MKFSLAGSTFEFKNCKWIRTQIAQMRVCWSNHCATQPSPNSSVLNCASISFKFSFCGTFSNKLVSCTFVWLRSRRPWPINKKVQSSAIFFIFIFYFRWKRKKFFARLLILFETLKKISRIGSRSFVFWVRTVLDKELPFLKNFSIPDPIPALRKRSQIQLKRRISCSLWLRVQEPVRKSSQGKPDPSFLLA